ncbi:hypothetical protein [Cupriavidus pinatubonensis]|uniref:Uncharacterized protein n=1 Tax=Cupriavidus pinatubonensis TaxID=248026 RepID=A0ABN7Y9B0_9BURK|nr:hypothetical protein [Cupriavidus pinatubonensis]CAG9169985.1 hypothetical protein LMG23994_01762 [Cupriavidus pinatubonensis]
MNTNAQQLDVDPPEYFVGPAKSISIVRDAGGTDVFQGIIAARSDINKLSNASEGEVEAVLRNANVKIALKT